MTLTEVVTCVIVVCCLCQFLIRRVQMVFPEFQYLWLAEETKKNLPKELDFLKEGQHCERVGKMFAKFKFLKVTNIILILPNEI